MTTLMSRDAEKALKDVQKIKNNKLTFKMDNKSDGSSEIILFNAAKKTTCLFIDN